MDLTESCKHPLAYAFFQRLKRKEKVPFFEICMQTFFSSKVGTKSIQKDVAMKSVYLSVELFDKRFKKEDRNQFQR